MKVLCLTKRWAHHTPSGGYDRLANALGALEVRRHRFRFAPLVAVDKVSQLAYARLKPYLLDYRLGDRLAEEQAYWASWLRGADIVHVLYGDEQLDTLLRRAPAMRARLVTTFHLPAERARERFERVQTHLVERLAGAIVVSTVQLADFRRWLGPEKVCYVPHGIDTAIFRPGERHQRAELRLVLVGFHMRDFFVAHRVMDRCAIEGLNVTLEAILPEDTHSFFTACSKVILRSRVPEAELIRIYQQADALFLPVASATANNAVLEALACGTPVISTAGTGIADYVDDSCGWLLPHGDADAAFELISKLAKDPDLVHEKRSAARRRSKVFSWPAVAQLVFAAYECLIATGRFAAQDDQSASTETVQSNTPESQSSRRAGG
jgi:glycosyltransferase involved in cell wall biosynthesis